MIFQMISQRWFIYISLQFIHLIISFIITYVSNNIERSIL